MKTIDFEVEANNHQNDIKKLYNLIRPEVKFEEIEYKEFSEGVCNLIVRLDDETNKDPIGIRVNGFKINSEKIKEKDKKMGSNRELELAILEKANDLGICSKVFASFENGLIYKFVDGVTNSFELYDLETAKKTAIKMAKFHRIDVNESGAEKEPVIYKYLGTNDEKTYQLNKEKMKEFDLKMQESEHDELRNYLPKYSNIFEQLEALHELILERNAYGSIYFCHNDLHQENLIIEKSTKNPFFIDFELVSLDLELYQNTGKLKNNSLFLLVQHKLSNVRYINAFMLFWW